MKIRFDVTQHAGEFLVGRKDLLGGFALLENFLGLFLIVPEIRLRGFFF
jgi:hypothetical protein